MNLQNLIGFLEKYNPNIKVPIGFGNPHSWRGIYNELSFEPVKDTTVGKMLTSAYEALDETYQGWKGGDFTMTKDTTVNFAFIGECGEGEIHITLLKYMVGDV